MKTCCNLFIYTIIISKGYDVNIKNKKIILIFYPKKSIVKIKQAVDDNVGFNRDTFDTLVSTSRFFFISEVNFSISIFSCKNSCIHENLACRPYS